MDAFQKKPSFEELSRLWKYGEKIIPHLSQRLLLQVYCPSIEESCFLAATNSIIVLEDDEERLSNIEDHLRLKYQTGELPLGKVTVKRGEILSNLQALPDFSFLDEYQPVVFLEAEGKREVEKIVNSHIKGRFSFLLLRVDLSLSLSDLSWKTKREYFCYNKLTKQKIRYIFLAF